MFGPGFRELFPEVILMLIGAGPGTPYLKGNSPLSSMRHVAHKDVKVICLSFKFIIAPKDCNKFPPINPSYGNVELGGNTSKLALKSGVSGRILKFKFTFPKVSNVSLVIPLKVVVLV